MPAPANREVLLIRTADPAMSDFRRVGASQHPLNLLYLATYLNANGFKASVYDLEVEPLEGLRRRLAEDPPLLGGVTTMTTGVARAAGVCALLKAAGSRTVVGGSHATALPAETLRDTGADFVITGEGERPLLELTAALSSSAPFENIEGLAFARDGAAVVNPRPEPPDMDSLPVPDRSLLRLELYRGHTTPGVPAGGAMLFTARGCPFDCAYCASRVVGGGRVRQRSIAKVMEEVDYLAGLGFTHITVDDDTLTLDRRRVLAFCAGMKARRGLTWNCTSRADAMDRELMEAMRDAGCIKIAFGVESGSQRVLDAIGKRITVAQARECFRLAREAGLPAQAFFMVGHPEETQEDIAATEALIHELKPDLLFLSLASPLPGTRYHEIFKREGWLPDIPWRDYGFFPESPAWRTRHFTGPELTALRKAISRRYYFSPAFILRRLAGLRRPDELLYLLKGAFTALRAFVLPRAALSSRRAAWRRK